MYLAIQRFAESDTKKHTGVWIGNRVFNGNPRQAKDDCQGWCRSKHQSFRLVSASNNAVLVTCKWGNDGKVVTTYNSSQFEDYISNGSGNNV